MVATAACVALVAGMRHAVRTKQPLDASRVYVAWFENRTGERALDPVGGMASDWVAQGIERTGVVSAKDDARRAADLGAGTLVSGTYYRIRDRLRFHVRVSDVGRGEVLHSFDAEGGSSADPSQPLEVVRQRTIGSLASLVDPRLSSWVRVASKPPSYEAYREFVTG